MIPVDPSSGECRKRGKIALNGFLLPQELTRLFCWQMFYQRGSAPVGVAFWAAW